jgi:hypothetical protein
MAFKRNTDLVLKRYKEAFMGLIGTLLEGGVTEKDVIVMIFESALKEAGERWVDEHEQEVAELVVEELAKKVREPRW